MAPITFGFPECGWTRARSLPLPSFIVRPGSAEEVSKDLKIANYYKIPVQTWGGGSGSQGSALAMAGGITLDIKRMNRLIKLDEVSHTITAETGMVFQTLEWYARKRLFHYAYPQLP